MLEKLKKHWKVGGKEVILILCTFAVTGTLTAWLSKKITEWLFLDKYGFAWWFAKIVVLVFGYQVIILIVGYIFGMFPFFWKYEKKILQRLGFMKKQEEDHLKMSNQNNAGNIETTKSKKQIAVFASGAGSNAQKIIDHFRQSEYGSVALIVCNKPGAGVLQIAEREHIPVLMISKKDFSETGNINEIQSYHIDFIVLAGFLWKVPELLIRQYPGRIINIHPALLPDFGGKGMYGHSVHAAVIDAGKKESGITIHYVDEKYDHGNIIFQATCEVDENDTPDTLAQKIHVLEHRFFPVTIEKLLKTLN